jgi:hypothetical protein
MSKNTIYFHGVIPLKMGQVTKFLSITLLVAALFVSALPLSRPPFYPDGHNSALANTSLKQTTTLLAAFALPLKPGHDFGAIYGAIDPGAGPRISSPAFTYWSAGLMVVRRSELGILAEPLNIVQSVSNPGHDFGAIYNGIDPGYNPQLSSHSQSYSGRR